MRIRSVVEVYLATATIMRRPSVLERVRRWFGGNPDLSTDQQLLTATVAELANQVGVLLQRLAITNAVALRMDDRDLFVDLNDRGEDVPAMLEAFARAAADAPRYRRLEIVVAHKTNFAALRMRIQIKAVHQVGQAAVRMLIYATPNSLLAGNYHGQALDGAALLPQVDGFVETVRAEAASVFGVNARAQASTIMLRQPARDEGNEQAAAADDPLYWDPVDVAATAFLWSLHTQEQTTSNPGPPVAHSFADFGFPSNIAVTVDDRGHASSLAADDSSWWNTGCDLNHDEKAMDCEVERSADESNDDPTDDDSSTSDFGNSDSSYDSGGGDSDGGDSGSSD